MIKDDMYFINIANSEGEKALKRGDYPAGCIIVKNKEIIAKASSTGISKNDITCHAELNAIREASRKLKSRFLDGCNIQIYTNIEPCIMCAKAIVYAHESRKLFLMHTIKNMEIENHSKFSKIME